GPVLVPVRPPSQQRLELREQSVPPALGARRRPAQPGLGGALLALSPSGAEVAGQPGPQRHDEERDAHDQRPASAASISAVTSASGSSGRRRSSAEPPPSRPSAQAAWARTSGSSS